MGDVTEPTYFDPYETEWEDESMMAMHREFMRMLAETRDDESTITDQIESEPQAPSLSALQPNIDAVPPAIIPAELDVADDTNTSTPTEA